MTPEQTANEPIKMFSYVVDHDTGYAPNPYHKLCTLVGCMYNKSENSAKFNPRRNNIVELAKKGNWIVGLGGKSERSSGQGTIIYAMQVTDILPLKEYCQRHTNRADAKPAPHQPWRRALISNDYYYFGNQKHELEPAIYDQLKVRRRFKNRFTEKFIKDFVSWLRKQKRPKTIEPCDASRTKQTKGEERNGKNIFTQCRCKCRP